MFHEWNDWVKVLFVTFAAAWMIVCIKDGSWPVAIGGLIYGFIFGQSFGDCFARWRHVANLEDSRVSFYYKDMYGKKQTIRREAPGGFGDWQPPEKLRWIRRCEKELKQQAKEALKREAREIADSKFEKED